MAYGHLLRLVLVSDSLTEAYNITNMLRSSGHAVKVIREQEQSVIEELLISQSWEMVICKDIPEGPSINTVMATIKRLRLDLPCIGLVAEHQSVSSLYESGVKDLILSSDLERLQFAVSRELKNLEDRRLIRQKQRALSESEKRCRLLLYSSREAIAYLHQGIHLDVNPTYASLFGYQKAEDIIGLSLLDFIVPEQQKEVKKALVHSAKSTANAEAIQISANCLLEDKTFPVEIVMSQAALDGEKCTQAIISRSKQAIDFSQLKQVRDYHPLTGLYGRSRFIEELEKVVDVLHQQQSRAAVLYLVLNNLQFIKEHMGLLESDRVIQEIAGLLKQGLEETDLIGQYGEQVFTIIVNSGHDEYVDQRAQAYCDIVASYTVCEERGLMAQCSIGISDISQVDDKTDVILSKADKACRQAQKLGKNHFRRYQSDLSTHTTPEELILQSWKAKLEDALLNHHFTLHYQPIVSLHGQEAELYEVLLRLNDVTQDELISASEFIGYATELGLMGEIDRWVLSHALPKLTKQREAGQKTRFFIKLSPQSLIEPTFFDWLESLYNEYRINAEAVILETNEVSAVENMTETQHALARLKNLGGQFGIEDFGSGQDYRETLNNLDMDYLKISGQFIEDLAKNDESEAAAMEIIELCKQAGKTSIAEFVSDASSLALLWRLGVDYAQGYYIQEPSSELDYKFDDEEGDHS